MPTTISTKNRKRDWINCIVQVHDLQCECGQPLEHTLQEIYEQEPQLKPTCATGTDPVTTGEGGDGFGDGDLEQLFAEDIGEENAPNTTTG